MEQWKLILLAAVGFNIKWHGHWKNVWKFPFLNLFHFFNVYECFASMYVFVPTCVSGVHGVQKESEPLGLELQAAVRHVGDGVNGSSERAASAPNC